jgi:NAD(P)-dependent dehydrogenase (short-subunit alcohol dehydrogenase family)
MATRGLVAESAEDVCSEYAIAVEAFHTVIRAVLECERSWESVSVVFASSMAVETMPPGSMGYAVGKAAGESFCKYMAYHPPGPNWRFNVLRIGRVSRAKSLTASVAKLADFLLDEESEDISGQVFTATAPSYEEV